MEQQPHYYGTKLLLFRDNNASAIYWLDSTGGGANLAIGDLYAKTNVANDTQSWQTLQFLPDKQVEQQQLQAMQ